jgi:hypothetical protein
MQRKGRARHVQKGTLSALKEKRYGEHGIAHEHGHGAIPGESMESWLSTRKELVLIHSSFTCVVIVSECVCE